ncbi:hypothetical protein DFH06DRAFT_1044120 [Mycena polygramma]|nr:hypothetical protein DFH06DRAFT_1044120 [Mycena polygramma]
MVLSLLAAELFSIFLAGVLYGIYLVSLGIAVRVLLRTKSGWSRSRVVVGVVSAILFVNSTLDFAVAMEMIVRAFVLYKGPGGPERVFTDTSSWQPFTKSFCVAVQTLTGDAILIYRCWFIWSKSWLTICLPMLLWLGNFICQIAMLVLLPRLGDRPVNSGDVLPWGLAFWILTICTNVTATSLIVWRIRGVEKQGREFLAAPDAIQPPSTLNKAMRNIIESGMIYTATSILELAAFATQSYLNYPGSVLVFYSIGITFNLIIIRGSANQSDTSVGGRRLHFPRESAIHFTDIQSTRPFQSTISSAHEKPEVFLLADRRGKDLDHELPEPPAAHTSNQYCDHP